MNGEAAAFSKVSTQSACRGLSALAQVPIVVTSEIERREGFDFHPRDAADLHAMRIEGFLVKPTGPRLVELVKTILQAA